MLEVDLTPTTSVFTKSAYNRSRNTWTFSAIKAQERANSTIISRCQPKG